MRRALTATGLIALAAPAAASAHGLVSKEDLPVPSYLFAWGAAAVLVISFIGLAVLWPKPRLQAYREKRLIGVPPAFGRVVEVVCGALGVAAFAAVVYAGFAGDQSDPNQNLAPTVVYVFFWVAIPGIQLFFGDLWSAFNPWRAVARLLRLRGVRAYPAGLGRWPAVLSVLGFAILELAIDPTWKDDPSNLAWLAVAYAAVQLVGYAVYGTEQWGRFGDGFQTYFGLFGRLSPWHWRRDGLHVRPPLAGVTDWEIVPGSVALLCVAIGTTSFDGFSTGPIWAKLNPHLTDAIGSQLAAVAGIFLMIGLISSFYFIGISGMPRSGDADKDRALAGQFVHTLAPIALAYLAAHYFSLVVFQGQALGYLLSDPLNHGSNLFGTADWSVDLGAVGGTTVSYVQVIALVLGHAAGLTLAHDKALTMYSDAREAARSQYWMLAVMVGFTSLGLYLLFAANR